MTAKILFLGGRREVKEIEQSLEVLVQSVRETEDKKLTALVQTFLQQDQKESKRIETMRKAAELAVERKYDDVVLAIKRLTHAYFDFGSYLQKEVKEIRKNLKRQKK